MKKTVKLIRELWIVEKKCVNLLVGKS